MCESEGHEKGRGKSWEVLISGVSDWWIVGPRTGFMGVLHVPLTGPCPSRHPGGLFCSLCSSKAEWPWSVKWYSFWSFLHSFNPYRKPMGPVPGHEIKAHSLLSSYAQWSGSNGQEGNKQQLKILIKVTQGLTLCSVLCYCCLENLNGFWTKHPIFSFCTRLYKLCSQFCWTIHLERAWWQENSLGWKVLDLVWKNKTQGWLEWSGMGGWGEIGCSWSSQTPRVWEEDVWISCGPLELLQWKHGSHNPLVS